MKATDRVNRRSRHSSIDDSPEAIDARMDAFVQRTRGWGSRAIKSTLPDNIVVLAGPTRKNQHFKQK
ncbi:hypothetical protein [Paraburkholderia adhaesiva]|uniref:hypothetical protein n=1 Tax=Paraburkholderia adhaesiva TaxID=2883244 RepID=UPI001F1AB07C|nr:hypothetical protein [Paraburkholderia adhaesiva]